MRLTLAAIVIAVYICVIVFDFMNVNKKRTLEDGRRIVYAGLLSASFAILILYVSGVKLPIHFKIVQNIIKALWGI